MIAVAQYILFVLAIILFSVIYPISGSYQKKKLIKENVTARKSRIYWYWESITWSWIPTLFIITVTLLCGYDIKVLGIRPVDLSASGLGRWMVYPSLILFIVYLGYNIYSIIVLKSSRESRQHSLKQLPDNIIAMLPVTKGERKVWTFLAITAGISEEIQFRGYLFFAIQLLFPQVTIWLALLISTFLFGIGHIYQGKSAIRPTIAGLFFGILFIVFDSIIPIIIIHIIQDLVVRNLLDE